MNSNTSNIHSCIICKKNTNSGTIQNSHFYCSTSCLAKGNGLQVQGGRKCSYCQGVWTNRPGQIGSNGQWYCRSICEMTGCTSRSGHNLNNQFNFMSSNTFTIFPIRVDAQKPAYMLY